jgi:hypothetical protein
MTFLWVCSSDILTQSMPRIAAGLSHLQGQLVPTGPCNSILLTLWAGVEPMVTEDIIDTA